MKELSIEQKAQRYDEAIEIAKDSYKYPDYPGFIRVDVVFPELKEGEDERIRKELIDYFKENNAALAFRGISNECVIAWLEKQGEPVKINPTEFDTRLQALIGKFDSLPKEELIGSLSFWMNVVQNDGTYKSDEKQGEQKPTDNVIEEEKPLLEKFKQAVYDCAWGKVTCKKEGETKKEYANRWAEQFLLIVRDWADDYIDFTIQQKLRSSYEKGKSDITEKQSEQKPTEWSEEDEEMIDSIIGNIKYLYSIGSCDNATIDKKVNWLKSLTDRYTWKPSEAQLVVLDDVIKNAHLSNANKTILIKLYNDLKKLREE